MPTSNNFIFADLSTYEPQSSMDFYQAVFGWRYKREGNYYSAYKGNTLVSGLYETSDKFKAIGMPHFWMSYIQVDDLEATVESAKSLGGIIEMTESAAIGKVALIRDPLGAGFTVYQGSYLKNARTENKPDRLIWNELHVSNAEAVMPFYEAVLGWQFKRKGLNKYEIFSGKQHISDLHEIPNSLKGKYEYWACCFGVSDLEKTIDIVKDWGGKVIYDMGANVMVTDNSGEAFIILSLIS